MKTHVYLRPPKKLLENVLKLKDAALGETLLDLTGSTEGRAVLHLQKNNALVCRRHRVTDSDDAAPFAFTEAALAL
jgi:hypothetical protein